MTVLATRVPVTHDKPILKVVASGRSKSNTEKRPVTATLACPEMLDIKFLKKLDMTSFTKKGLIAISKICGISIVKRVDDKRMRKRLKGLGPMERVRKDLKKISLTKEPRQEDGEWKTVKRVPKIKVTDGSTGRTRVEGTKNPSTVLSGVGGPKSKGRVGKTYVDEILYRPVAVAEPCKTCGRKEQPERFHSHPNRNAPRKVLRAESDADRLNSDGKLATPKMAGRRRHSTGHLSPNLGGRDLEPSFHSDHEIESIKMPKPENNGRLKNTCRSFRKLEDEEGNFRCGRGKKDCASWSGESTPKSKPPFICHQGCQATRCVKVCDKGGPSVSGSRESLKYVTGCYVCGMQMSSELRIVHEEQCISTWRKQNSQLPPDKRKPEPLRPDFRFTASGDVDFEGTFKSIWANHVDSLVPCNKCRRTFFPDRIERHEECCNGQPTKPKYQLQRSK